MPALAPLRHRRTKDREARVALRALYRALAARDLGTAMHSWRVARLSARVGRARGLAPTQCLDLFHAALLHDVGKLQTPDHVLLGRKGLGRKARAAMQQHVRQGCALVASFPCLRHLLPAIAGHHEHWAGGPAGYPAGTAGSAIPIGARVIAACDAFDAMTSDRPYRVAMSRGEALDVVRRESGRQFDPEVVRALIDTLSDAPQHPCRSQTPCTLSHAASPNG